MRTLKKTYDEKFSGTQDDPLSALDQHVGKQIFDEGVRKFLLRNGRTVIMVTHKVELLSAAHQVSRVFVRLKETFRKNSKIIHTKV